MTQILCEHSYDTASLSHVAQVAERAGAQCPSVTLGTRITRCLSPYTHTLAFSLRTHTLGIQALSCEQCLVFSTRLERIQNYHVSFYSVSVAWFYNSV